MINISEKRMHQTNIPLLQYRLPLCVAGAILIAIAVAKLVRAAPDYRIEDLFLPALVAVGAVPCWMRARNLKTCPVRWSAEVLEFQPSEKELRWIPAEKVVEDGVSFQLIGKNREHSVFLEKNAISSDLLQFLRNRK
jgi:hypothetical protein